MEKIPTLLVRGPSHKVTDDITPGCEWVTGKGVIATEKLDGTNVKVVVKRGYVWSVWKRQTPKAQDPFYARASDDEPADKYIMDAARQTNVEAWPDGEYICEAIGPRIQGNPLGLGSRRLVRLDLEMPLSIEGVRHRMPHLSVAAVSFDQLRDYVTTLDSSYSPGHPAEGIVFWGTRGRRAKIKRRDFA